MFSYSRDESKLQKIAESIGSNASVRTPRLCSLRTLSEIASGTTSNLLTRAANVMLKERRRLVLMVRETPPHSGHLKIMLAISEKVGIVTPPMPIFYNHPETINDLINHTISRVLDLFDVDLGLR